jgi:hypothetical protein
LQILKCKKTVDQKGQRIGLKLDEKFRNIFDKMKDKS